MTDPTKLAEEIEKMDQFGARAADRALIAAALRYSEASVALQLARDLVHEVADDADHERGWELSDLQQEAYAAELVRDSTFAAYRSARGAK